jgi:hypothetical protein
MGSEDSFRQILPQKIDSSISKCYCKLSHKKAVKKME